jgi:hypothetical protein
MQRHLGKCLLFCPILLALALVGCDLFNIGGIIDESKQWRAVAETQTQVLVRAVPGERYLQLIDDLNSGDPKKVTRAQTFMKQLGHFDPSVNWEATIMFGFDEQKPLHADAFFAFSPSKTQVDFFVQNTFNPKNVTNAIEIPQTANQLNSKIDDDVDQLLKKLTGDPSLTLQSDMQGNPPSRLTWPNSIIPESASYAAGVTQKLNEAKARQGEVAGLLKALLKAQYERKSIPAGGTVITLPWFPTDGKNFLFVGIPESDWNQHKDDPNFRVSVLLHKEGDAAQSYLKTNEMTIEPAFFNTNVPVDRPAGLGKVRWAAVDPTHASASIPNVDPNQIAQVEKLLQQVIDLNKKNSN